MSGKVAKSSYLKKKGKTESAEDAENADREEDYLVMRSGGCS